MHHATLDRAGSHNRHFDHEIVKTARLQARQHAHLGAALDLEHAHGIGLANHVVGGRIFSRDVLHRKNLPAERANQAQAAPNGAQHAQRQHIDLEQSYRIQVVLVPLDDGALRHGGVLHRHQASELALRQHKAADVLAQVAREALQIGAQLQPELQLVLARRHKVRPDALQRRLQALRQHLAAVHARVLLGQRRDQRLVNAERTPDVAQGAAWPVADHHRRQRGTFAPVLGIDVLNHLFAPIVFEVDVDVGRLVALAADETLKQHAHARGIDLGHAQAITDRRVGGRTAPLAQDVPAAGKVDDVMHGQKIHLVFQFSNQVQLMLQQLLHRWQQTLRIAARRAFEGKLAQRLRWRQAGQHGLQRILVAQFVQAEMAALRDQQRVGQQLGRVERGEPLARAQMGFGVGLKRKTALAHCHTQPHGGHDVVQRLARAHMHVHIATGHQRQARVPRQLL